MHSKCFRHHLFDTRVAQIFTCANCNNMVIELTTYVKDADDNFDTSLWYQRYAICNVQCAMYNMVNICKIKAKKLLHVIYDDYLLPSMVHADSAHSSAPHRASTCLHRNCGLFKLPIQEPTWAQREWFAFIQYEHCALIKEDMTKWKRDCIYTSKRTNIRV